jgi:hypothetical protein
MTITEFDAMPPSLQVEALVRLGTWLATRSEGGGPVRLFHLPGEVFVEVFSHRHVKGYPVLRAFTRAHFLDQYLPGVALPAWLRDESRR